MRDFLTQADPWARSMVHALHEKISKLKPVVRDFIYLDWERVRSIAAQLFRGVPEEASLEKGRDTSAHGKVEGRLLNVVGAEGGVDHRFFRTENETRSFHHHVYSMVEDELKDRQLIVSLDEHFQMSRWQPDVFKDGDFVEIIGLVRLMDYQWMTTMMEALPRMIAVAHNSQNVALKNQLDTGKINPQAYQATHRETQIQQKAQLDTIRNFKLGELSGLLRQLYGEAIRVKVVPSLDEPEKLFVGSGDLANFHDTAASLAQKYGFEIDANWHTVGQINRAEASGQLIPLPIGNAMEDSFEQVAFSLNQLIRIANAPKFPAISFTPLSIYRLVGD